MSFERIILCACGHSMDDHEAGGCRRRVGAEPAPCRCELNRVEAIDVVIESERIANSKRWRSPSEL